MSDVDSFATLEEAVDKSFDYIVCGGGTAGLTLAARLSDDPTVSVLVLDAGYANLNDPAILVPGQYNRQIFQDQYDWKFFTVPQKFAKDKPFLWSRGKSLGGSSAFNFLIYMRPPAEDIDAWEELGNTGWNWATHLKYMKRGEKLTPPTPEQTSVFNQTYDPESHGTEGGLQVGFPSLIMDGEVPFQQTMINAGIPKLEKPLSGDVNGTWMAAATIDPIKKTRSYSATAFYVPYKTRTNLKVLMEAHVNKIVFASALEGDLRVAEGVEFTRHGKTYTVKAHREVILSAGGIKSPQILELSGIGDPEVLKPLGIDTVVSLPGVGNNVQDHIFYGCSFELDPAKENGWNTLDKLRNPELAEAEMKLFENQQGLHTMAVSGLSFTSLQQVSPTANELIASLSEKLEKDYKEGRIGEALWEQYQIQLRMLKNETSVDLEFVTLPYFCTWSTQAEAEKAYMTVLVALNHPFSRGTIHVASTDPQQQPVCDPHYFENDFDMQVLLEGLKFVRKLKDIEPFKSIIVGEVDPSPKLETEEELRAYIIQELNSTFHTAGACSMLPREKGGVVDSKLKVYGTTNVRVVDLSIVPLHFASHPQASVYGIAEQAADMILGKMSLDGA